MDANKVNAHSEKVEESKKITARAPNVKVYPNGFMAFPIAELRRFGKEQGIPDTDGMGYTVYFEFAKADTFNYCLGEFDRKMDILIFQVFYVDVGGGPDQSNLMEEIMPTELMKQSIMRRFLLGEAGISGTVIIDRDGKMWIRILPEDNLEAVLVLSLDPKGIGCEFNALGEDGMTLLGSCRMTFDGATFYYDPVGWSSATPPA